MSIGPRRRNEECDLVGLAKRLSVALQVNRSLLAQLQRHPLTRSSKDCCAVLLKDNALSLVLETARRKTTICRLETVP